MTSTFKTYPRPPIVEAVIELTFAKKLDRRDIERTAAAFSADFPGRQDEATLGVRVEMGNVTHEMRPAGIQLSNPVTFQTIVVREENLLVAQGAPYPGWDEFFPAAWSIFKKGRDRMGYRPISRIGIRYINRIDIPYGADNSPPNLGNYVKTGFNAPPLLGMAAPNAYLTQGDYFPPGGWAKAVVRTATTTPALIRHASVLLDIDIFVDTAVPQAEGELEKLLNRMRGLKNEVFSNCITVDAEALFEERQ